MYGGLPITTSKPPAPPSVSKTSGNSAFQSNALASIWRSATMLLPTRRLMVEAGQLLALDGRLDPEAELGDVDGFVVQVDAIEVFLEDLAVQVEKLREPSQLANAVVGPFVFGVELVKGFDQERPATAGRVENPDRCPARAASRARTRAAHRAARA